MLEILSGTVFYEIAALLVLASVVGIVGIVLRQPLIVSFIAVGIIAGPSALDLVQAEEHINLLAKLGIAVLLFLVGLKLDLKLIRSVGPVALITGLGQVMFTSTIGFGIGVALGYDLVTSAYIAVALTFSSTIIIVKLLSDKREIDSLHGRIALGFLIVQDIVVVLSMIILAALGAGAQGDAGFADVAWVFGYAIAMLLFVGLFIRYVAEPLVNVIARAPELLVSFAIGWAALFAATGDFLGFGKELGGLLSGVSLASTQLREAMAARLAPLRDFLLLFFFIALGSQLDLSLIGDQVGVALLFSLFVLIGNPLIVLAIMGAMGYRKRTGFLAGLTVAQISEFSLIFMAMGVTLGHVSSESLGLVTLVGLITIALSTYMITYSHQLYALVGRFLGPFERRGTPREAVEPVQTDGGARHDILIFGLGRYGGAIAQRLKARGVNPLAVDFNPVVIQRWRAEGIDVLYGDVTDPEFISHLPLEGVAWVVSTVPEQGTGVVHDNSPHALIYALRDARYQGRIAITSHREDDGAPMQDVGADLILLPFHDAADQAADLLTGQHCPPRLKVIEPEDQKELAP
jgi:Kef-type K+ transport system membrane component KefB